MKKVLVIGGAGFIGSHTADELSNEGYQVTIFDHQESRWLRDDQKIIIGDILNRSEVEDSIRGMDIVYQR